ncbi:MAG: hypothetical protein KC657_03285 [Myxococcales bacterium]|nr:hypothetical protein [Myxococcales bacterium]
MRAVALLLMIAAMGCDKQEPVQTKGAAPSATVTATASAAASASAAPTASAPPMPERPIPQPSTTVGSGMPQEVQMKAIAYMSAMRAPRPGDPNAEPEYAAEIAKKIRPALLAADKGRDKAKMNRVEVIAGGRQIDLLMSAGCDPQTATRVFTQGAGIQLSSLRDRGVLVVRCNDAKFQCLQSTRDTTDVLCTTAPRH